MTSRALACFAVGLIDSKELEAPLSSEFIAQAWSAWYAEYQARLAAGVPAELIRALAVGESVRAARS